VAAVGYFQDVIAACPQRVVCSVRNAKIAMMIAAVMRFTRIIVGPAHLSEIFERRCAIHNFL
jgi:hypothetical protein